MTAEQDLIGGNETSHFRQFGALCHRNSKRGVEVLLITTRQTRRWMIPKGWSIPGLDPMAEVEQEAWEEAGVVGDVDKAPFGKFRYDKHLADGRNVRLTVEVHLLKVRKKKKRFPEMAQRDLLWISAEAAFDRVEEPELKELLRNFSKQASFALNSG